MFLYFGVFQIRIGTKVRLFVSRVLCCTGSVESKLFERETV